MPSFTSVSIIFNPNSTGDAEQNAKNLADELRASLPDVPVKLLPTQRAGHAIELAYETAKSTSSGNAPLIVSASGDGGYHEVVNGALRAQQEGAEPICAVLPSGNANDHARTMQQQPLGELIKNDTVSRLDVLQVTIGAADGSELVKYAHSYVGLGLTPTIAVELNKHTLNSLKEAWIVLRTFWNLRPVRIKVNDKILHLDSLICSIIPEMAKVITLSDQAEADDGQFELVTFPHNNKPALVFRLAKGVFGHLGARSRVGDYNCTILVDTPAQLDGEVVEIEKNATFHVSIRRGMLRTVV